MRQLSPRPAALVATAALLLAGCSGDEPAADPDRIVLEPPAAGAGHTHAPGESEAAPIGDGTRASAGGYRLADLRLPRRTEGPGRVAFRILDRDGDAVVGFADVQTKLMHLYVVRTDYAVYRHVHPTMDDAGTWSAAVDLPAPGDYRVIADFQPEGAARPVVLGAGAPVPGRPAEVPPDEEGGNGMVSVAVDGTGRLGPDGRLRLVVSTPDGDPVTLGTYLGTSAHVSGFRVGGRTPRDRVFVHVHPYGEPEQTDDGAELVFHTDFERAGAYRLFVQVRVDGIVHTVPVTATVAT